FDGVDAAPAVRRVPAGSTEVICILFQSVLHLRTGEIRIGRNDQRGHARHDRRGKGGSTAIAITASVDGGGNTHARRGGADVIAGVRPGGNRVGLIGGADEQKGRIV